MRLVVCEEGAGRSGRRQRHSALANGLAGCVADLPPMVITSDVGCCANKVCGLAGDNHPDVGLHWMTLHPGLSLRAIRLVDRISRIGLKRGRLLLNAKLFNCAIQQTPCGVCHLVQMGFERLLKVVVHAAGIGKIPKIGLIKYGYERAVMPQED